MVMSSPFSSRTKIKMLFLDSCKSFVSRPCDFLFFLVGNGASTLPLPPRRPPLFFVKDGSPPLGQGAVGVSKAFLCTRRIQANFFFLSLFLGRRSETPLFVETF